MRCCHRGKVAVACTVQVTLPKGYGIFRNETKKGSGAQLEKVCQPHLEKGLELFKHLLERVMLVLKYSKFSCMVITQSPSGRHGKDDLMQMLCGPVTLDFSLCITLAILHCARPEQRGSVLLGWVRICPSSFHQLLCHRCGEAVSPLLQDCECSSLAF